MEHPETIVPHENPVPKQSGLGIASFVIAVAAGLLEFVIIMVASVLDAATPGGIDENSPVAVFIGLTLIGGLLVDILGIGLGIGGLCQRDRRKLFAVLGVVIGSTVLVGVLLLVIIGLIVG